MVITEQTAFPFVAFWFVLKCHSSLLIIQTILSNLHCSINNFVFIFRKIMCYKSLQVTSYIWIFYSKTKFFFFLPVLFLTLSFDSICSWLPSWCLYLIHFLPQPVHVDGFRFCTLSISFLTCSPSEFSELRKHHSHKHLLYSNFLSYKTFNLQGKHLKK